MGTTSEKLTYLNTTKTKIKDAINLSGANITTEPFRQYENKIKQSYLDIMNNGIDVIWDNWEKVVGEGTELTLNNTEQAPMKVLLKGNTYQDSTTGKNILDDTTIKRTVPSSGSISVRINMTITAGTYRFGCFVDGQFVSTSNIYSFLFRNGDTNIVGTGNPNNAITITQEQAQQVDNVLAYFNSTFTDTYKGKQITGYMLVSGSTLGEYEPYTGGNPAPNPDFPMPVHVVSGDNEVIVSNGDNTQSTTYPINLPEGMFLGSIGDYKDRFFKTSGYNLFNKDTVTNDAFLLADGTVEANHTGYYVSDYIPVTANTGYYKKYSASARAKYYNSNKEPLNTTTYQDISIGGEAGNFTTPDNAYYLRITFTPSATVTLNNFMILKGTYTSSTLPPFEPYGTNEWYLEKKIGKVVLDGSETWVLWNLTSETLQRFYTNLLDDRRVETGMQSFSLCDRFTYYNDSTKQGFNWSQTNGIYKQVVIRINRDKLSTVDVAGFKSWLANNEVNIYYVLATPTYTKIEGTLESQLEEVYRAKSKEGQTNISQTNNDLPFILDVSALKEI